MKEYIVRKVANGYMVTPAWRRHRGMEPDSDVYVFKTWAQVSAWMRKEMEPKAA